MQEREFRKELLMLFIHVVSDGPSYFETRLADANSLLHCFLSKVIGASMALRESDFGRHVTCRQRRLL